MSLTAPYINLESEDGYEGDLHAGDLQRYPPYRTVVAPRPLESQVSVIRVRSEACVQGAAGGEVDDEGVDSSKKGASQTGVHAFVL